MNEEVIIKEDNSLDDKQDISNNYKTFNKLKELQTLLTKESALKELCKKS
jgi:hypothetical protein